MSKLLNDYPDVKVALSVDSHPTDIIAERLDVGGRLSEQIAKDMIAVRIGPELRMAVVATPSYLAAYRCPERPHDLSYIRWRLFDAP